MNRGLARDRLPIEFGQIQRTKRSENSDEHLKIKDCNLLMEQVADYLGYEIPNYQALGLKPSKAYKMYRPASEIEKAVDSFSVLLLLDDHHDTEVDVLDKSVVIGCVGNARFEAPFLKADISVQDKNAIENINSNKKRGLSPQYYYSVEMTPGEFDGVRYDGIMRDLEGLNVALVKKPRGGDLIKVSDSKPEPKTGESMSIAEELAALMAKVNDASPDEKEAFEAKFREHQGGEIGDIKLENEALKKKIAELEAQGKKASDEGDNGEPKVEPKEPAKDSELEALKKKVADMEAAKKADDEKAEAQEITNELIGKASDSASALDIYVLAAKELNITDSEFKRAKANDALPFLIKKSIEVEQIKKQHQAKANDSITYGGGDYASAMSKLLGGAK